MKKLKVLTIAALVTGAAFNSYPAFAQEGTSAEMTEQQQQETTKFLSFSGKITEVNQEKDKLSLVVENPVNSQQMIFPITDEVLAYNSGTAQSFDKNSFKKGLKVEAYYDKNKPMPLIYPATITPDVLIVQDEEKMGQVKIAKFNKELVSLDRQLKLNLADNTALLNEQGEKLEKEDLSNKELAVFYTRSTKSIPAQTTPTKVIALDSSTELSDLEQLIEDDHYMNMKEEIKMIPLRKVAEHLEYEVDWQQEASNVMIRKQNSSFQITPGNATYSYNKSLQRFEFSPEIKDGKLYVPEEFLEMLNK